MEKENNVNIEDLVEILKQDDSMKYYMASSQIASIISLGEINFNSVNEIFVIVKNNFQFKVDKNLNVEYVSRVTNVQIDKFAENEQTKNNDSIIGKISQINTSGVYEIEVQKNKYSINLININGDLILDGINTVNGATLKDKTYQFGNEDDVATENTNAKNMIVLKVNGNITINEDVVLTTYKDINGYGGPKGLLIYCTEKIDNKGTISMSARGAKAEGQNVYLWNNTDGTYEFVPKEGALGGKAVTTTSTGNYWTYSSGNKGNDGLDRQTGGGGSRFIIKLRSNRL